MSSYSYLRPETLPDWFRYQMDQGRGEALAKLVILNAKDRRGKVAASRKSTYVPPSEDGRMLAQMLVAWYGARPEPMPDFVYDANVAALGLHSRNTGEELAGVVMREALGVPQGVDHLSFIECAGRDALTMAIFVAPLREGGGRPFPDLTGDRIVDGLRLVRYSFAKSGMSSAIAAIASRLGAENPDWPISARAMGNVIGISANSVSGYRKHLDYRHMVSEVAVWCLLLTGLTVRARLAPDELLEHVKAVPFDEILHIVNSIRSVWSSKCRTSGAA